MINSYAIEQKISNQILRIGHVYGPGEEKYAKIISKSIQNIVKGNDVELWGEGMELRSFIYIDDVVSAIIRAIEIEDELGIINLVGGNPITIYNLLTMLVDIGNCGSKILKQDFSGSTRDFVFDNAKLQRYLLREETDFRTGILSEFKHIEKLNLAQR